MNLPFFFTSLNSYTSTECTNATATSTELSAAAMVREKRVMRNHTSDLILDNLDIIAAAR
jgi:hypothetical protein